MRYPMLGKIQLEKRIETLINDYLPDNNQYEQGTRSDYNIDSERVEAFLCAFFVL